MSAQGKAPSDETPRETIMRLTPKRIAAWCNVSESAVHQWLVRKADTLEPVPPRHLPAILNGAEAEGLPVDIAVLWPAMRRAAA